MKQTIFFLFYFLVIQVTFGQHEIDSLLERLENEMDKRGAYDIEKKLKINNLKNILEDKDLTLEQKYYINNNIISEYEAYSFDSTLFYIEKNLLLAKQINNKYFEDESFLNLSKLLASSGRYKEAIDILNEIDRDNLSEKLIKNYYLNYKEGFSGLSFYTLVNENKQKYSNLYNAYKDSVLTVLTPNSIEYLGLFESKYLDQRELKECLKLNSIRLGMTEIGTRDYSLITFERSLIYGLESDREQQKKYLILSAISDIQASVKDNASLTSLALMLFKDNDINRAHKYINFSFEDADFYNSRLRFVLISNILPVITKAHEIISEQQKSKLKNLLIVISLLGLGLLFTVFYIVRQMKKLAEARNELLLANNQLKNLNTNLNDANSQLKNLYDELSESNLVKEHYIGTFLNIYSNYIDKLDTYRKMVKKHIVAKKVSDLFERTKSTQIIDEELKLFYKNFDDTFLHIYPNFVEELNALLVDEGKVMVKNKERLNTELRIFALIRLGITDSSKIAKLLRYSVNTIYNYRVKIKNKSIGPRENFEEQIMKIGSFKN